MMVQLKTLLNLCYKKSFKYFLHIILNQNQKVYFIYSICFVLFTIEILTYYSMMLFWHQIQCENSNHCTKVLLVADPQIIGIHNEHHPQLTPIAIWDSDRYLHKTFWHAYSFTNADVVIFLGDLLDEGASANDIEFTQYVRRFYKIFEKPDDSLYVWNAGDNDIGGEFPDYVTHHKIERFNRAFLQADVVTFKNIRFFKANAFLYKVPIAPESTNFNQTNIVLSHVPLLANPSLFVDKILDSLNPKLLFTAHIHKSMVVTTRRDTRQNRFISPITPDNTDIHVYKLNSDSFIEIIVPTCSYRMGTTNIGYGFAVLEPNTLQYTVLWTPSRFFQLKMYGVFLIFLFLCGLYKCTKKTKKYTPMQPPVI